jgi:hypothetical protein
MTPEQPESTDRRIARKPAGVKALVTQKRMK